ncbi:unnamed protein product [Hyaloperonospora brassicae]|nr:unnamed protein product [Hyaloperonospora brassicae]
MNGQSKHTSDDMEDIDQTDVSVCLSPPRRQKHRNSGRFDVRVTPEPSRRRLSTSQSRPLAAGMEESPARYSPSKVKAAVRSFADFLHFLEKEGSQEEDSLMPVIIQRFAELGAVIESQKRHIDRWKGKELDLAIEEAQQNLELIRELGETIHKQELQIAEDKVEKQKLEEKYHLAAQEVESLKKQGTYQIQQLHAEVETLRQAGSGMEAMLKERDVSLETLQNSNDTLRSQLERVERDSSLILQENTTLKQQEVHQADKMNCLEQEMNELREHCKSAVSKYAELEQHVTAWQTKYEEKDRQVQELENALKHSRQDMGQQEGNLEHVMGENRKLQEHMEHMAHEHEKHLAEQHRCLREAETERQRLNQALEQESARFLKLKKEAGEMQAQIEAQAMSAMNQREQQLMGEKSRLEEELRRTLSKVKEENAELRAEIESLKDINQRKSTEIGRLMASSQEADQQKQCHSLDTQRIHQLMEEVAQANDRIESMSNDLAAKDAAHEEAMKAQSADFEHQYNEFVSQVEGQFNTLTHENEQLRAELDETAKQLKVCSDQSLADRREVDKWHSECETLQRQLHGVTREHDALKREYEHQLHEMGSRDKDNAELRAQIEHFLSPGREHTNEVELLQNERARLEDLNRELRKQIEAIRVEADARFNEAQQLHNHSIEQEAAHASTVRVLCEEKEAMNRDMMTLSAQKSALEAEVTMAINEIERWKTSVQLLENSKCDLELQIQEVMRQATEQIESHKHSAAVVTEDGRTQLQTLTAQLVRRDTQMNEGHQQLRHLQETVESLEEKLRAEQYEHESLQMANDDLTVQLESLYNERHELEDRLPCSNVGGQPEAEEGLLQKLERFSHEMDQQVQNEREKAIRLQTRLDAKLESERQRSGDDRVKLKEEIATLQQQLSSHAAELEKQDAQLSQLLREREEQDRALDDMQETIAAHESEKWTLRSATNELEDLKAAHEELKAAHDQMKAKMKAKVAELAGMQEEVGELRYKLDEEKATSQHLFECSRHDRRKHSNESQVNKELRDRVNELKAEVASLQRKLRASEQHADDKLRARVEELETQLKHSQRAPDVDGSIAADGSQTQVKEHKALMKQVKEYKALVKQLEKELEISKQSVAGREQSAMHETLQKEREHRSLQVRYDKLAAESAALTAGSNAKAAEIDHLHQEIDRLEERITQLHEEIRDNMAEMDNARAHLDKSEQLTLKLEGLQDELVAQEIETRQYESELAAKKEEMQQTQKDIDELKRRFQDKLRDKEDEVSLLKQRNAKFQERLKRIAQAKLSSKHTSEVDATARETAMSRVEETYKQAVKREQKLTSQIAKMEDARSALVDRFRREMERLHIEVNVQGTNVDGDSIDDSAFHRGIMEIAARLHSYQDRETYQTALIHRKDKRITELKMRLDEVEKLLRLRDNELKKREEKQQQDKVLHEQMATMNREVSKLKLENKQLRGKALSDPSVNASAKPFEIGEWKDKCAKLKHRVCELQEMNTKLKQGRSAKGDVKALAKEVDKLAGQVLDKDLQIQALRNRETTQFQSSRASTGPRRMKDLLVALQKKEDKIMALNDHLTGLMTENMRLQHSTEQYVVQYGPLCGATTDGVIGNSGIKVPARTNESNWQQPAVRSQ